MKEFVGESLIHSICDTAWEVEKGRPHVIMKIKTLEGEMLANEGDYIIKGLCGEFYPCKPEVFEKKYEVLVENDNDNVEMALPILVCAIVMTLILVSGSWF